MGLYYITLTFSDQWFWRYKKPGNKNKTRNAGRLQEHYKNIKPRVSEVSERVLSHIWLLGKMVSLSPLKVLILIFLRCGNVCSHKSDASVYPCDISHPVRDQPSGSGQVRPCSSSKINWIFNLKLIFWAVSEMKSSHVVLGLSDLIRSSL